MTKFTTENAKMHEALGLGTTQRRRMFALFLVAIIVAGVLPFVSFLPDGEGSLHEWSEVVGLVLIGVAIVGRTWCTLYIGGRKSREIVATGPYSVSRNPLYLFSFVGIAGIGAQAGSIILGPILVLVALAIFLPVIEREEAALSRRFGPDYDSYRARVPRFGPRLSAWQDMEMVTVSPKLFWRTLREGLAFLLVIPYCEGIEMLQHAGYLTPLVHLP
jgi:protein-S-isoprenylcysteine O-methyltransferase Ste14